MICKRVNYFLAIILTALSLWVEAAEEPAAEAGNGSVANAEGLEELVINQAEENDGSEAELEQTEGDDDFVPSAQISEDLSVSFPVDI